MRVGVVALLHESNTFIGRPTTIDEFRGGLLATGAEIRQQLAEAHHEIGGFLAGGRAAGLDVQPLFAARAVPYGTIGRDCFEQLVGMMLEQLVAAGPLDGVLAAPHGATVAEGYPDADGYWLGRVRELVGRDRPLIATLDPHANLSPAMLEACDAVIAYRTNPHLDQRERGVEAARLMARTLRGEVRPVAAAAYPPLAISIDRQQTDVPPFSAVGQLADQLRARPDVLSVSVLLGFPYADVREMGSSVVVVTDGDRPAAQRQADELAAALWGRRNEFRGEFVDVDTAVRRAAALPGPVCLLDMGDNVGGGSPGDGTVVAEALARHGVASAFVCLCDPVAVKRLAEAAAPARLTLAVGGKTDARHGAPWQDEFRVLGLFPGRFSEPEPRHGGFRDFDQGPTAVVRSSGGLTCMLTSRRIPPFSLRQLTSCGLDPGSFQILVAKGVNAPLAAYGPVCRHVIRVDTPGVTRADMTRLEFRRRRRPMFPFEVDVDWTPEDRSTAPA